MVFDQSACVDEAGPSAYYANGAIAYVCISVTSVGAQYNGNWVMEVTDSYSYNTFLHFPGPSPNCRLIN